MAPFVPRFRQRFTNAAVHILLLPLILTPTPQVDKEAVAPFVPRLLRALVMCFKDASWPVSGRCLEGAWKVLGWSCNLCPTQPLLSHQTNSLPPTPAGA